VNFVFIPELNNISDGCEMTNRCIKVLVVFNNAFQILPRHVSESGCHLQGVVDSQGRPLGGASGALAPGADFEGAPKRGSHTGHTLIRSTVAW
jgi:hypothetical protein